MTIASLRDMYVAELQEAQSAKAMQADVLPAMAAMAASAQLGQALLEHCEMTRNHEGQLRMIIERLHEAPDAHVDQSVQGLIGETMKMARMSQEGPVRDAALIASTQRLGHYGIAVYGTLRALARSLRFDDDAEILSMILSQERDNDTLLTDIAVASANPAALEGTGVTARAEQARPRTHH